jgi:FAD/FMN-containing dehydrogenase
VLIGAEGTLGLITAAALRLFAPPAGVGTAMMVVGGPAQALALLELAEAQMGGGVLAFELIHRQGLLFVDETMPQLRQPFAERPEWMVLIDLGVPSGIDAQEALATLFEAGLSAGLVSEGVVAQNAQHREEMWALREALPEANRRIGSVSSHDISVPLAQLPAFISQAGQALARISDFRINCFGHVGDGNLHYNVFPAAGRARSEYEALRGAVKDLVHGLVTELGGSISAEHGIGRIKRDDLRRYVDPTKLAAMRAIKSALDPNGIMNPGAVIG